MSASAILSDDFQLSIPTRLCEQMKWQAGQELILIPEDVGGRILPVSELETLRGIAKGACTDGVRDRNDRF